MENQIIKQQQTETLSNQSMLSLTSKNRQGYLAKTISENIYVFGFNGTAHHVAIMAQKIDELFEDFDPDLLTVIFNEYADGTRSFKYQFNIVNITDALRSHGVKTKHDKIKSAESKKIQEEFFAFQKHSFEHNSKK